MKEMKQLQPYVRENLFGIEGWNIAWYGVVIGVGIFLGLACFHYLCSCILCDF